MAASSRGAVIAAVAGNGFITIMKSVAFALSGSGAMLSEAIHSAADTGNQALLYLGIRRSERPPDAMFHYGYGGERFLFALLSAVGIFVLGCGVTVYHGIHTVLHPPELTISWVSYAVLALAFVVDGAVFYVALRAVWREKGDQGFWQFLRTSPDPTVLAVLFEDLVACIGVLVAAGGIALASVTGNTVWDGVSSITIGIMLGGVAIWLGYRNRQLILGQAIPKNLERAVVSYMLQQPSVTAVRDIKTRVISADRFKLKAEVDYDGRQLARAHLEWAREHLPDPSDPAAVEEFVMQLGDRVLATLSTEIDRMEREIAARYPRMKHLDLESDVIDDRPPAAGPRQP